MPSLVSSASPLGDSNRNALVSTYSCLPATQTGMKAGRADRVPRSEKIYGCVMKKIGLVGRLVNDTLVMGGSTRAAAIRDDATPKGEGSCAGRAGGAEGGANHFE